jgi:hypothetical protein
VLDFSEIWFLSYLEGYVSRNAATALRFQRGMFHATPLRRYVYRGVDFTQRRYGATFTHSDKFILVEIEIRPQIVSMHETNPS